jgi:hypothetical protein
MSREHEYIAEEVVNRLRPEKDTPSSVRRKNLNPKPESQLDISQQLIEVQTGRKKISNDLENLYKVTHNANGSSQQHDAWGMFNTLTIDVRGSNLDPKSNELNYINWGIKMQGICSVLGLPNSLATTQWLILSVTEPSLAKNMAFRNSLQTIRQESQHVQIEQPTKSTNLFGMLKNKVS